MRLLSSTTTFGMLFLILLDSNALGQDSGYVGAGEPTTSSEVYGQGVRETAWRSPSDEQAGFHLPPGFKIELFASEPQIDKPLNMAWDSRGRLWVTNSREYPYPAQQDARPRDSLTILEDTDGDGRADKSTRFADGLNIPIGVLPVVQGNVQAAICFSIPNLWLLRDNDGDDRVDEHIKLLGPFDTTRDTHGMVNSLTRGDDGWVYACHGFNNQSEVTAADGSRVQLTSGNTFRFREDGSRIEQVTWGQVNPFGMTRDQWGNWYSADCHSKPLTALLPGAYYPSFGRPHDGLGFAPSMMDHLHGSTAICGLLYYQAEQFPLAYRQRFYSGNVMTSRINCNALEWRGATATARELPDFLTSDDPWFRPVDIQLGPDGALYIADFYNKIIGHYEVPLDHPERDRESGRIWRISFVAGDQQRREQPNVVSNLSDGLDGLKIDATDLPRELASNNATRRRLAIELALANKAISSDTAHAHLLNEATPEAMRIACLEILFRQKQTALTHARPIIDEETHHLAVRQLSLAGDLPQEERQNFAALVRADFPYAHPQINLAACRLLGLTEESVDIERFSRLASDAGDPALAHTARIALKNVMSRDARLDTAMAQAIGSSHEKVLANVLPAIDSPASASALLEYLARHPDAPDELVAATTKLAIKHATRELIARLLKVIEQIHSDNLLAQTALLDSVCESYLSQHSELPSVIREYGSGLQTRLWQQLVDQRAGLGATISWSDGTGTDWSLEQRSSSLTQQDVNLRSSFTRGEGYTGQLVSDGFPCPQNLRFLIAGHNGPPNKPDAQSNKVELRLLSTGQTLHTAWPPRSDVAAQVNWPLDQFAGQAVRVVITDGDARRAYAWLAVGEFSYAPLNVREKAEGLEGYRTLVRRGFAPLTSKALERLQFGALDRTRLIAAGLQGAGSAVAGTLVMHSVQLGRTDLVGDVLLTNHALSDLFPLAKQLSLTATVDQQRKLVSDLVRTADGCRLLGQLLSEGALSTTSCRQTDKLWPSSLDAATRDFLDSQFELANSSVSTEATILARIARVAQADWNAAEANVGQQLFQQHCAACHQLRGVGAVVGPQLDGAVVRGVQRLCEDILDPNLNVDRAFRLSAVLLDDDSVLTGLVRDDPNGSVSITGQDGKTKQFPASRIQQRRETAQSLMPNNFGELLNDQQLAALMAYLTNRK